MSKRHQKIVQELQEEKPEDYLKARSTAHQEAIKLFEKEAKDDSNPQLVSLAKQQLSNLREHMNTFKELQRNNGLRDQRAVNPLFVHLKARSYLKWAGCVFTHRSSCERPHCRKVMTP
jgi:hypothetical protein